MFLSSIMGRIGIMNCLYQFLKESCGGLLVIHQICDQSFLSIKYTIYIYIVVLYFSLRNYTDFFLLNKSHNYA